MSINSKTNDTIMHRPRKTAIFNKQEKKKTLGNKSSLSPYSRITHATHL